MIVQVKPIFKGLGASMAVWWLRLHSFTVEGMGLNPGQGTKILHATWQKERKKEEKRKRKERFGEGLLL